MAGVMTAATESRTEVSDGGQDDRPSYPRTRARYRLRGALINRPAANALSESLAKPRPWMGEAVCRQVDADLWFPQEGRSCKPAKDICRTVCPVRAQCLAYADEIRPREGVWGGLSQNELRRHWRADETA